MRREFASRTTTLLALAALALVLPAGAAASLPGACLDSQRSLNEGPQSLSEPEAPASGPFAAGGVGCPATNPSGGAPATDAPAAGATDPGMQPGPDPAPGAQTAPSAPPASEPEPSAVAERAAVKQPKAKKAKKKAKGKRVSRRAHAKASRR